MAVRGWVAEEKLRAVLSGVDGITRCERLDREGSPDLVVTYRDGPPLRIECKNVLRRVDRHNIPRLDFQRTRASKADPCSRYYAPGDFEVVAACLHAITEAWEFRYALTSALPPHGKCTGKIASNLTVGTGWAADPARTFELAYSTPG